MQNPSIVISGTGLFTPQQSISNEELVIAFNAYVDQYNAQHQDAISKGEQEALAYSNEAFIEKASGIKSRYVLNKSGVLNPERMGPELDERDDEQASIQCEMAVEAAHQALNNANLSASDIDAVIVACSNLQRAYPAIAIEVQSALGIDGFAYDMNVACSSATFGIQAAYNAILSGSAKRVLMVNPEICSAHVEWRDRDCHFIFGDACTAVIIENESDCKSDQMFKILGTKLKTSYSNNIRNNFGFLNRSHETDPEHPLAKRDKLFRQNGRKVFKEVCPMVAQLISDHLCEENISVDKLSRLWLHQANLSMNELIAKRVLGRDPSPAEAPVTLDEYANTSSAGSIIAFHQYSKDLGPGSIGVICSFGAGYSVGSILLEKQ
jgi:beta-ketodecanoyl-[acyl-carrier-protein] synthase